MNLETIILILILLVAVLTIILIQVKIGKIDKSEEVEKLIRQLREELRDDSDGIRRDTTNHINSSFRNYGDLIAGNQVEQFKAQNESLRQINESLLNFSLQSEQKLENIRQTVSKQLGELKDDNNKQIAEIRNTVDEKLQKTLNDRITQSFNVVNDRLEQVYKGLGEMQTLASGVGDLKRVLTNVKTRGILGEVQLAGILEQILSPEQYDENVSVDGSAKRVEFAIKLPGLGSGEDSFVYLPIDAKFPGDSYIKLLDAYDSADAGEIDKAGKQLEQVIKSEAKDICNKYVKPPLTTDFAIMFLPFEGLYAEVIRRGLVEVLQRDYKVNIAGPTTMTGLLNSLQMGFRTLAIQKHSSEVWEILGAVKTEFENFGDVLEATKKRIDQANVELDKLIGVRTRSINRKLKNIEKIDHMRAGRILELEGEFRNISEE
ncbi:MAG: DNA recombination protein RmuC [Eubacterium sp.]|nr:DNA recombination protein RmuC [Eubacterium sp.]